MSLRLIAVLALLFACATACGGNTSRDIGVTVFLSGEPIENATVWFVDSITGEITDEGRSDEHGQFCGAAPNGATVSAAIPFEGDVTTSYFAFSLVGVEVGEEIRLGDRRPRDRQPLGAVSVQLPGVVPNAGSYDVSIGCTSEIAFSVAVPVVLQVDQTCVSADGNIVVVAYVRDSNLPDPVAYTPPQIVRAPAPGEVVEVELPAYQTELETFTVDMVGIADTVAIARTEVVRLYEGIKFEVTRQDSATDLPAGVTHEHRYVPAPGLELLWRAAVGHGESDRIRGSQTMLSIGPPGTDVRTVDFANDALPVILDASAEIGSLESPVLSWDAGAGPIVADSVLAHATWTNMNMTTVSWDLFAPADGASVLTFPPVPDSLRLMRGVQGFPIGNGSIVAIDIEHIASYDEFRSEDGPAVLDPVVPSGSLNARLSASGESTF